MQTTLRTILVRFSTWNRIGNRIGRKAFENQIESKIWKIGQIESSIEFKMKKMGQIESDRIEWWNEHRFFSGVLSGLQLLTTFVFTIFCTKSYISDDSCGLESAKLRNTIWIRFDRIESNRELAIQGQIESWIMSKTVQNRIESQFQGCPQIESNRIVNRTSMLKTENMDQTVGIRSIALLPFCARMGPRPINIRSARLNTRGLV